MRDLLVCDDPIAERRYAYARAAARDGEWAAAAKVLEQALELAPNWPLAWFALGEARERLGEKDGAADAFRAALAVDPSDAQGARGRLALLGEGATLDALSPAYVARLFDDYAARFDAHLAGELGYRGPELIAAALDRLDSRRFSRCIDLGCGTGLAGAALRERVDTLIGVDLSPRMIAKARGTGSTTRSKWRRRGVSRFPGGSKRRSHRRRRRVRLHRRSRPDFRGCRASDGQRRLAGIFSRNP
jgi:predicted TPR repeat methyltransferase